MSEKIIKEWVKEKYDHISVKEVRPKHYRVNLYQYSGENLVKKLKITKSYYLFIDNDLIEDKTIC